MQLQNEFFNAQISIDTTYTVQSTDNRHYDVILNPENYKHSDYYKTLAIHIDLFVTTIDIALVGNFYSYASDCAILEDKILTIMQNDELSQIRIDDGSLVIHKKIDCFGCNLGLYRVSDRYIIHGEMEIIMLDSSFNKLWIFSGRDIFVTQSNKKAFEICDQSIYLHDWIDHDYKLDFDGNLIFERPINDN